MTFNSNLVESGKNRVIGLDILRSIAILLVMYEHGNSLLPGRVIKYFTLPRPSIDGVSIFFVLSGFLIGGILLKIISTSGYTIKDIFNFWIRRWLRTIPNYYFVLIILIFCEFLMSKNIGDGIIKYFFFTQNLYQPHPSFFPEAWSLSIEEWFYLLFPVLTYLLFRSLKNKNRAVIIAAIIFLIIPLILRIMKYYYQAGSMDWDLDFRKIIILRLDSLMYGILGAYFSIFHELSWKKIKKTGLILSGIIILFLITYSSLNMEKKMFDSIYHFNLESIAVLFSLPYFSQLQSIKYKKIAFLFTFISLISYSMYLTNLTLIRDIVVPSILDFSGLHFGINQSLDIILYLLRFFLYWFLTIFLSYFLYRYLELPVMNLRNRVKIK